MTPADILERLDILRVAELRQHEERIPANLLKLKEAMLNIGQLVDPIIVDKEHKIILDGNHRVKVLEMVKVPNAVCQMVDYKDPTIKIGGWFPTSETLSKEVFKGKDIRLESVGNEEGRRALNSKKAAFMLVCKEGNFLVSPGTYDIDSMVEEQQRVLTELGNNFDYIADDVIQDQLNKGRGALFRKNYTKEEVIERAIKGKPFPPKSTRHSIPNRIIRLNMRLGWLHQDKEEAWKYLRNLLHDRVYGGNVRRYVEPVIVIY